MFLALLAMTVACEPSDERRAATAEAVETQLAFNERPSEDDVIYFLITDRFDNGDRENDRGGIEGDRLQHGFDPEDEKFYHGGDLQGITKRLDYLEELRVTAIWITPVFANLPVQQFGEWLTASYHGYWIADFTKVDPHLGTDDDLHELIRSAHKRDIKVILDIVVNHTADVIQYRECHDPQYEGPDREGPANECLYRSSDEYPYNTRGDKDGEAINAGFLGDDEGLETARNFTKLTDPRFAYTPYIDEQLQHAKTPDWLNDPIYYHNRGELVYTGESFYFGDFYGLDAVFTEHPRAVRGMIDIYQYWIREFGIDGFRIDTAGHVQTAFWSQFAPAMRQHAAEHDRPEFFMFGEVVDTVLKKRSYVTDGNLPAVLDFDFQEAVVDYVTNAGSAIHLADFFADGDYFIDHDSSPYQLPTFLGNHDLGRFGVYLKKADPNAADEINLQRSVLAHAILFFTRGIPILYYGDEQGFMTDPGFHESREDMFPSVTASYNDNDLFGTDRTTGDDNFDREHPLYRQIRQLSVTYRAHPALRRGDQIERYAADGPGVFAFSRIDPAERIEYLVLVNNDENAASALVPTGTKDTAWDLIAGTAAELSNTDNGVTVTVAPSGYAIYRARQSIPLRDTETNVAFANRSNGDTLDCSTFVEAVPTSDLTHVEFGVATGDGEWRSLGIDRDPPFRAYVDIARFAQNSDIVVHARTQAYAPRSASTTISLHIGANADSCK